MMCGIFIPIGMKAGNAAIMHHRIMLRSCRYCGRIHERGYICPKKPPPKKFHKDRRNKEKFRSTIHWQRMRDSIVSRDMGLCQICLENGTYTADKLEVHHITALSEDFSLRLDRLNLITLCAYHHKQADDGKIDAEKLRKMAERNEEEQNE